MVTQSGAKDREESVGDGSGKQHQGQNLRIDCWAEDPWAGTRSRGVAGFPYWPLGKWHRLGSSSEDYLRLQIHCLGGL